MSYRDHEIAIGFNAVINTCGERARRRRQWDAPRERSDNSKSEHLNSGYELNITQGWNDLTSLLVF